MAFRRIITRGGSFDSELGLPRVQDNESTLTLVVKVHLRQMNPSGTNATGTLRDSGDNYAIRRWTPESWQEFTSRVASMVDGVWDGKQFLTPPRNLPNSVMRDMVYQGNAGSGKAPYVTCNLDVRLQQTANGSHASLRCYRLADSETKTFRSFIEPSPGRDGGILVDRDVYYEIYFDADGMRFFNTIAHEIGHVLGLNHPGGASNSAAAYGLPGTPEYREVMGFGTNVTPRQAAPWKARIKMHTDYHQEWGVTATRPNQPTLDEILRNSFK
jgi:hypothetical protein